MLARQLARRLSKIKRNKPCPLPEPINKQERVSDARVRAKLISTTGDFRTGEAAESIRKTPPNNLEPQVYVR